jgi:5-methylcytosine-specific restriction endonuclease McrA
VIKEPIPDGMKQCSKCKQIQPATNEYFARTKDTKDGLFSNCKACVRAYAQVYNDTHKEEHAKYRQEHKEHIKEANKQRYEQNREEIRAAQNQYRELHKEEWNANRRRLRREDPVARERMRELKRQSDARHRDEIRERRREHYQANKELINKHRRQRYPLYREKRLAYLRNYAQSHTESLRESRKRYYQEHKNDADFQEKRKAYMAEYYQTEHGKMASRAKCHRRRALKMSAKGAYTAQDISCQMKRQHGRCYYCDVKFSKGKRAYHVDHVVPLSRGGTNDPSNLVLACNSCNSSKKDKFLHEWERGGRLL